MDHNNDIESVENQVLIKSSTGLEENIAGLLCYLGTIVTGIIFFALEKNSSFVKFHAMQSIVLYVFLWILGLGVGYVPFVGWLLKALFSLIGFILWIVLMVKAYHHEQTKLPIVGDITENVITKFENKQS
ncbi:DUF4870 domain-containing protein [Siminovitchia sediminis]|uniref:DUF4870 domain-containing protein n=1 Tax=Siminovitchia sediminis TaxID=1274353 RepID=A0ABW4KDQ7_9BACI